MGIGYRFAICSLCAIFLMTGLIDEVQSKKSKVLTLTSDTWQDAMEGEWIIKFFAPWCPACRAMEEDYKEFADWSDDLNINVAEVNINDEPGLSGRFIVTALPSIYHAKNGDFRRYTGARDTNSLHKYIENESWRHTEPVGWYRHPNSIAMSLMAGLFQTSVIMKKFHETLTETYGYSTNMAYVIFAIATIVTGLVLGLILVFIIDCVAPPKGRVAKHTPVPEPPAKEADDESQSEEEAVTEDESKDKERATQLEEQPAEEASERKSVDGSSEDEEGHNSQASSKSSSRTSQEWEQVQGLEADEAEKEMSMERSIPDEPEEGQGELRHRVVTKKNEEETADE